MLELIDSHAHLNDKVFDKVHFDAEFFEQDGYLLKRVLTVGYDKESILKTMEIVNNNERIYGIVGCHPQDANEYDDKFEKLLITCSTHNKVVAVGEIGLDFYKEEHLKTREQQTQVFIKQLELAHKLKLPVVIHIRDAFPEALEILKNRKHLLKNGGLVHCFTGTIDDYKSIKELGLIFSVGGPITFKNAGNIIDVVKNCDINDLLIETDCPYLTPEPFRGRVKNQPIMVRFVFKKVAEIRNMQNKELERILLNNTNKLFKKLK